MLLKFSVIPFLLVNLAITCFELKQIERSHRLALQALNEAREHGEPYIETASLLNLGQIAILRGDAAAAWDLLRPAIRMAHASDDPSSLAAALTVAGDWVLAAGDRMAALRLWDFVARHPQVEESERAAARRRLAAQAITEPLALEGLPSPTSFDAVIDHLFARFDAA